MALAPFRVEKAVKEILLVKALPLRVVLLYRTVGWNARLFRKSLCKSLKKALPIAGTLSLSPQQRVNGSADTAARRWRREWLPMGRPGIAAVWRRRQEGAKTPSGFLIPLLTPPHLPSAELAFGDSSKCEGPTDAFGAPQVTRLIEAKPVQVNSGRSCVPKAERRTEPSPRFSRLAANAPLSGSKESLGS